MIRNIIITGIGGQGVVTSAGLMRWVALAAGYHLAGQDNRGGAQRLGHVSAIVRFSDEPDRAMAPEIPDGTCDLLLSLEASEGLRFSSALGPGSIVIYGTRIVIPVSQRRSGLSFITLSQCHDLYLTFAKRVISLDAEALAVTHFGKPVFGNLIALGLGIKLATPKRFEKLLETQLEAESLKAFKIGLEMGEKVLA